MSKANLCDICEKLIPAEQSFLFNTWSYKQYKVKIQYIKEENSNAGYFRKVPRSSTEHDRRTNIPCGCG